MHLSLLFETALSSGMILQVHSVPLYPAFYKDSEDLDRVLLLSLATFQPSCFICFSVVVKRHHYQGNL